MKKTYKKPITEVLPMLFTDYQMNTGSVLDGSGNKVSGLGEGTGGGDEDGDEFVDGDARHYSLWDDELVEYSKGLW